MCRLLANVVQALETITVVVVGLILLVASLHVDGE
jgi:hypothetical protein